MTEEQGFVNPNPTPPVQESYILIRFAHPNSTLLEIKYEGVSPLQVKCASWILERDATNSLQDVIEARKQQLPQPPPKLIVPQGYGGITPK